MNMFEFCPKGHPVTPVLSSLLYTQCCYCETCDKIYEPVLSEVEAAKISVSRWNSIRRLARIIQARKQISVDDLIKLGYIEK